MLFWIWIPGPAWAYGGTVLVESGFPAVDRKVHHFRRWMCYGGRPLNQLVKQPTQHGKRKHNRPMPGMWNHHRNNRRHQRAMMDGDTTCTSSTRMPLWRSQPSKTLGAQTTHTPARHTCVNATNPTHPTAGRKSTTPASTPTSTPPGPSDTAGQDAHNPSTTPHNPPSQPLKSTHFVT